MRRRTKARECSLKILYQLEISKEPYPESLKVFWAEHRVEKAIREFTAVLVKGVMENISRIDGAISASADNWEISRMAVVDRNILRIAVYELLFLEDIPPKVSINEAVDMAKKYGDLDSGKFVNGILDEINKTKK